ncbi:MAG: DUF4367 domain-containing protein [Defluviitaleaceae bacterium]|nr:DUF4367 domain-containing protein [Defluviitaleaceae bacterium]
MDAQFRNEITEAILRRAATEAHEREMAAIPPEKELAKQYNFTAKHTARMRALFKREERKESLMKIYAVSKRAAVIVLIMATALFSLLLTDSQVQATIRETIIRWYEQFTLFRFQGGDEVHEIGKFEWFPNFVPEGFEKIETINFYIGRHIFFEDVGGLYIIFEYVPASDAIIGVDNEYTEMETVSHNGTEYFIIIPLPGSEHDSQVLWNMRGYAFHLVSDLDSQILFEMALSVSPNIPLAE